MHAAGADPAVILNDLLELTHWLTRLKIEPGAATDALMPEAERARGAEMAGPLTLPVLARLWQLLLKGVGELGQAPSPRLALEMVLIRTAYAANLPSPAELVAKLQDGSGTSVKQAAPPSQPQAVGAMPVPAAEFRAPPPPPPSAAMPRASEPVIKAAAPQHASPGDVPANSGEPEAIPPVAAVARREPDDVPAGFDEEAPPMEFDALPLNEVAMERLPVPSGFREFVTMLEQRKIEPLLTARLRTQVRPASFETGVVALALEPGADPEILNGLRNLLNRLFGSEWLVARAPSADSPTIAEATAAEEAAERDALMAHPLVQAALDTFPGATVGDIRHRPIADPDDWTATIPPPPDEMLTGDEFEDEEDD
jgi:DNA polymerase-3 subunit gamma/tau